MEHSKDGPPRPTTLSEALTLLRASHNCQLALFAQGAGGALAKGDVKQLAWARRELERQHSAIQDRNEAVALNII